jgi:hypothetical protein
LRVLPADVLYLYPSGKVAAFVDDVLFVALIGIEKFVDNVAVLLGCCCCCFAAFHSTHGFGRSIDRDGAAINSNESIYE